MAKLSLDDTKNLLREVFQSKTDVRRTLHEKLADLEATEPQFYNALIEFHQALDLDANRAFDLMVKLPSKVLRDSVLMKKLSPVQREELPQATLGSYPTISKILSNVR